MKSCMTMGEPGPGTERNRCRALTVSAARAECWNPRLLDGLKAGDVIEVTYTQERAVDIQRAR